MQTASIKDKSYIVFGQLQTKHEKRHERDERERKISTKETERGREIKGEKKEKETSQK